MENVRIRPQGRGCFDGRKWVEFFEVVADSERFGMSAIMYQGDFKGCLDYLERQGIDYTAETLKAKAKRCMDVQVGNRMFRVIEDTGNCLLLKARDWGNYYLDKTTLHPIAPETFTTTRAENKDIFRTLWNSKTATVKVGSAKTW